MFFVYFSVVILSPTFLHKNRKKPKKPKNLKNCFLKNLGFYQPRSYGVVNIKVHGWPAVTWGAWWVKSNIGGGGGGQRTNGARAGKSRPRHAAVPGPENAPSGRSSNPKWTEPCGGTMPPEVPTTGEGRWKDDRSCFAFGATKPEPANYTNKRWSSTASIMVLIIGSYICYNKCLNN